MIKKLPGIYKISNKKNNRYYFGSAVNLYVRKSTHFSSLKKNKHYNKFLQRDFNKTNLNNFTFEVILYCDKKKLLFYEQKFLNQFFNDKKCYNLTPTAGSCFGLPHSKKTKEKLRQAHLGKQLSQEHKKNISVGLKNLHKQNINIKNKISKAAKQLWSNKSHKNYMKKINTGKNNPMYGKNHSEKTKRKISHKIKYIFVHDKLNLKEHVTQYELKKKYVNLTAQGITDIIKCRQKTHRGWKIINE